MTSGPSEPDRPVESSVAQSLSLVENARKSIAGTPSLDSVYSDSTSLYAASSSMRHDHTVRSAESPPPDAEGAQPVSSFDSRLHLNYLLGERHIHGGLMGGEALLKKSIRSISERVFELR